MDLRGRASNEAKEEGRGEERGGGCTAAAPRRGEARRSGRVPSKQ